MNKIVKKHYPVEKLPVELREGLPQGAMVSVTVETEDEAARVFDVEAFQKDLARIQAKLGGAVTLEEAAERVRSLRDEWED